MADAISTPQVQRCFALQELQKTIDSLSKSKGEWFSGRRQNGIDTVVVSKQGHLLLDLLTFLAPDVSQGSFQRRIEPRLQLVLECAGACLPRTPDLRGLLDQFAQNPRYATIVLSGLVVEIRVGLAKSEMDNRVRRHHARDESFFGEMNAYFNDLALKYPDAIVLRQELRRGGEPVSLHSPQAARDAHELMTSWLEAMKRSHGAAILGHAWRLQCDDFNGFHHHVLLVVKGPTLNDLPKLSRTVAETWIAKAGFNSGVLDCKGPQIDLVYRGRRTACESDTLMQELRDAAVYLSCTDSLVALDFDEQPPLRGFKSRPKVLRPSAPSRI